MAANHLIILACSGIKNPDNIESLTFQPNEELVATSVLGEELRHSILQGREILSAAVDLKSEIPIPALDRYNGGMYRVDRFRETIAQVVRANRAYVIILSGYYGVVTASERILKYQIELDVRHWTHHRLPEAINEMIRVWLISATTAFLNSAGPYQVILRNVRAQNTTMFFVRESTNPTYVYPALGTAIIRFLKSDFRPDSLNDFSVSSDMGKLSIGSEEL